MIAGLLVVLWDPPSHWQVMETARVLNPRVAVGPSVASVQDMTGLFDQEHSSYQQEHQAWEVVLTGQDTIFVVMKWVLLQLEYLALLLDILPLDCRD